MRFIIISSFFLFAGFIAGKFLGDDNIVEEFSEDVIEKEIGVKFDITPNSYEKNK